MELHPQKASRNQREGEAVLKIHFGRFRQQTHIVMLVTHTHTHTHTRRGSKLRPSKYPHVRAAEVFKQPYLRLYLSWRCAAERQVKGERGAAAGRSIRDMKHMPDLSCSIYR